MRVIVSGGLGYVGGRLCKSLAESGIEVIALTRQAEKLASYNWPGGMRVMNPDELKVKGIPADVFIHLAAMNEIDCVKDPAGAVEVNITQTMQWLEWSVQQKINRFFYFSTAHVYGKPLEGFYDENSTAVPVHPYAITHRCAEDYVLAFHRERGMKNIVIRLSNAFGGPAFPTADRWTLLVNDLCRTAVADGKMSLASDGSQLRDFICLEDVCSAVKIFLHQNIIDTYPVYNLSSGSSVSVLEMASQIREIAIELLETNVELTKRESVLIAQNQVLKISNEKLRELGYISKNNIADEIKATLNFFKHVYEK